jgi:hypothetical protein
MVCVAAFAPAAAHARERQQGMESEARAADPGDARLPSASRDDAEPKAPSPLEVDYAQYGVAIAAELPVETGAICPAQATAPCIIGIGGGPVLRGGYRPAGPWYFGGAYQFAKLDSNNLYRLGIQQQLRAELRYYFDTGTRFEPYITGALGGMVYGNEFSVQTGGPMTFAGAGVEAELTRFAVVGLGLVYEPMLFIEFVDTAGQRRETGVAHYLHVELFIELRSELGRE